MTTQKRRGRRGNREGSIYETSDGRWRAAISLDDGTRKYLTGRTRAEVAAKLRRSQQRVDAGLGFDTERLTVVAWLDHWLTNVVTPHGEPTTTEVYEVSIRLHIKPYVGNLQLSKLTPELVEMWLKKMEEQGKGARTRHFARATRTPPTLVGSTSTPQTRCNGEPWKNLLRQWWSRMPKPFERELLPELLPERLRTTCVPPSIGTAVLFRT